MSYLRVIWTLSFICLSLVCIIFSDVICDINRSRTILDFQLKQETNIHYIKLLLCLSLTVLVNFCSLVNKWLCMDEKIAGVVPTSVMVTAGQLPRFYSYVLRGMCRVNYRTNFVTLYYTYTNTCSFYCVYVHLFPSAPLLLDQL